MKKLYLSDISADTCDRAERGKKVSFSFLRSSEKRCFQSFFSRKNLCWWESWRPSFTARPRSSSWWSTSKFSQSTSSLRSRFVGNHRPLVTFTFLHFISSSLLSSLSLSLYLSFLKNISGHGLFFRSENYNCQTITMKCHFILTIRGHSRPQNRHVVNN